MDTANLKGVQKIRNWWIVSQDHPLFLTRSTTVKAQSRPKADYTQNYCLIVERSHIECWLVQSIPDDGRVVCSYTDLVQLSSDSRDLSSSATLFIPPSLVSTIAYLFAE